MQLGPQKLEQDVLVQPDEPPSPGFQTPGSHDGLLKDLVVLGDHPIAEVIVRDVGITQQH